MVVMVAAALVAAGCGGAGGDSTPTTAASSTTTTVASSTTTTTVASTTTVPSTAAGGLDQVRGAVVQIVAEGSFVDPEEGAVSNAAGSGTGFIISPDGIAVTNNHVVTGAAFLQVYVDGEDDPLNAKVLGVSECSDLAVIDIDGDGYPYLDWYDDSATAGMDVYAAGFPLGDPEYTLTEGIISKEKASGETNWASVDSVVEHTAQILPGNSGGPLVTPDGQVVAVNYAAWQQFDLQYAIGRDETMKVLPDLINGQNVTSIGVNGTAFASDELSGIWVSAVESGSPAANAGIKGGDIITQIEGLVLATDGTMSDYCDILRSHEPSDPLAIEVLRFETEEVLEGTLNSGEELTLAFSFAEELADDVATSNSVPYEYMEIYDDAEVLVMQVPTTWADTDGRGWEFDGVIIGNALSAATSLEGFIGTWTTPGVFFAASESLAAETEEGDLLDWWDFSDECTYDGTYDYEDALYTGAYDLWLNCGGTDTAFVTLEAYPSDESFIIGIQIQIVTDADLEAFDTILATFNVLDG